MAVYSGRKEGVVIPCNRVSKTVRTVNDFLPCDMCKGFYYRKTLWRHKRACASARGGESSGRNIQGRALSQLPTPTGVSHRLSKVLSSMRQDTVTLLCKTDSTILSFGEKLVARLGGEAHQLRHVSQKMRELGRLLQVLKETEDASLVDFFSPARFGVVISAVQQVCRYGEENVTKPSLALKLGHSVKKCAEICLAKVIERQGETETPEQFLRLHQMEWTDQVSRPALQTLKDGHWNKPSLIPMAEDIKKLQDCLRGELEKAKRELEQSPSPATYKAMAEALLARIILFNRRRQGEAGRMKLEDWKNSLSNEENVPSGVADCLSPLEKHLGSSLKRVMVRGKRRRGVPILLTREMSEAVELMTTKRLELNFDGPYLFAGPSGHALRGSDCLRKFVRSCGAQHPRTLTSGSLRKHVATMAQLLDLRENELDQLATFMGHDIRVHRDFYRLPDATTQVAKLSKVFILMESGDLSQLKGKTLDELDVNMPDIDHHAPDGSDRSDSEGTDDEPSDPRPSKQTRVSTRRPPGSSGPDHQESAAVEPSGPPPPRAPGSSGPDHQESAAVQPSGPPPPRAPGSSGTERRAGSRKRRVWSTEESAAVRRSLRKCLDAHKVPGMSDCLRAIGQEPALKNMRWKDVKYHAYNLITASKRRLFK